MGIKLKIWGDMACFTRPEMKVERVSYDVITPSAARGILEAIYWKPEIRWVIHRLHVLQPIAFTSLRRNEVGSRASAATAKSAMNKGSGNVGIYIEEDRQQRAATLLRDVEYIIEAGFEIVAGDDNPGKHLDQFNRRARKGQCFHRPYLGCREFPADFALIEDSDDLPTPDESLIGERDLGYMLYDIAFRKDKQGTIRDGHTDESLTAEPMFYRAMMVDGIIDVQRQVAEQGVVG